MPASLSSRDLLHISVIKEEIEILRSRIQPHDTGHLYTTISTLEHRIKELEDDSELNDPYSG